MDVVGHDDERVKAAAALAAVMLESFEKECGGSGDLKAAAAIPSDRGDKVGPGRARRCGIAMAGPSVPRRLKPRDGMSG